VRPPAPIDDKQRLTAPWLNSALISGRTARENKLAGNLYRKKNRRLPGQMPINPDKRRQHYLVIRYC
jgi:hypothetical protein